MGDDDAVPDLVLSNFLLFCILVSLVVLVVAVCFGLCFGWLWSLSAL
jgi:hypothetical protein